MPHLQNNSYYFWLTITKTVMACAIVGVFFNIIMLVFSFNMLNESKQSIAESEYKLHQIQAKLYE